MLVNAKFMTELEKSKWLTWVHTMLKFIPKEDLVLIPEITIYSTLISGIHDSFNLKNPDSDKTINGFYKNRVWAFACLIQGKTIVCTPKIALCVNREKQLNIKTPMELTFFHEVGHFHLFHNRPYKAILSTDEDDSDFYALVKYIKLLRELPHFRTFAESKNGRLAEDIYRNFISSYTHLSDAELAMHIAKEVFKCNVTTTT
ncbi:MAG: hypothetical protein M0P71_00815 [Melioribacteraceae bacterium]|nr:hypothetical protein [Melioribacteraceae bacterium]